MLAKITFVICVAIISVESVPKIISKPCKRQDTDCFNKIGNELYSIAITGDPDPSVKLEDLDPLFQDQIDGDLATVKYKMLNITFEGLKTCTVEKSTLAADDSQLSFQLRCSSINLKGKYEINGQLLALSVDGKGAFTLDCKDYLISFEGKIKTIKSDNGKQYIGFKNFKVDGDVQGGMKLHLSDLLKGRDELGETFLRFFNDNWREISKELQGPVFNSVVKRIVKNINKTLKVIPLDDMVEI